MKTALKPAPAAGDESHPDDAAVAIGHRCALRYTAAYAALALVCGLVSELVARWAFATEYPLSLWVFVKPIAFMGITSPFIYAAIRRQTARTAAASATRRSSQARLQRMAEMSSDWYWETDAQLKLTSVAGTSRHGAAIPSTNLLGKHFTEIPHFVLLSMPVAEFEALRAAHKPYRNVGGRIANPKGGDAYVSISGEPRFGSDDGFIGYHGVTRDVTNEFEALERLRLSEANFRAVAKHPGVAKALVLPDGTPIYVNRSYCALLGYTAEELLARNNLHFTHPDDVEAIRTVVDECVAGGRDGYHLRKRLIQALGRATWRQRGRAFGCRPGHHLSLQSRPRGRPPVTRPRARVRPWYRLAVSLCVFLSSGVVPAAISEIDDAGKTIKLARPASRIVSLSPGATELLFAAGAGAHLVATVDSSDYPASAAALPRVGNSAALNIEGIAALAPDLIIAWPHGAAQRQMAQLLHLNVPVFVSDPRSLADIAIGLESLGRLAGTSARAAVAARQYRQQIDALRQANAGVTPVRVFLQIWNSPLMTINDRHLIADALRLCGGRNVFGDAALLASTVGYESVIAANPEAIVAIGEPAATRSWLASWERWPGLEAVRYGSKFALAGQTISTPTPRMLLGTSALCDRLEQTRRRRSKERRRASKLAISPSQYDILP